MSDLSKKIINQIKKDCIKPIPKWKLIFMNLLLWTLFILGTLFGGMAISLTVYHFNMAPWEISKMLGQSSIHSFFVVLPYLWLLFLGGFFLFANYFLKRTKKGYRYSPLFIVSISLTSSLIIGSIFYFSKLDSQVDHFLADQIPPYSDWKTRRGHRFNLPEKGLIAGQIKKIDTEDKKFSMQDLRNQYWVVEYININNRKLILISAENWVVVKGDISSENTLIANDIHPLRFDPLPVKKIIKK